jgi:HME family heavy-metal exporter
VFAHSRSVLALASLAVLLAAASVPFFARTFLPPFNEGAVLVGLRLNPGTTLAESVRMAKQAEALLAGVPEVVHVGRRSGRAEMDEHAEGVHTSELDLQMQSSQRSTEEVYADMRARLSPLPVSISIGQPISHRIDHMLSGVRSQIALKLYGEDLDLLRAEAERLREALAGIPGLGDLEVEKQVLTPQIMVRVDTAAAESHGLAPAQLLAQLQTLVAGEQLAQVVEGKRIFGLVLRLPEAARGPEALAGLMIQTPAGALPLSRLARLELSDGPNQINRDDGKRRIVISANASQRPLSEVVADIRKVLAQQALPPGHHTELGGQFAAQEEATRLIALLSIASAALVLMLLYSRYKSLTLSLLVMANVPLALVGSVLALWISGQPLSVAALIGFITLAGIATRNGILKISHYVNLCAFEGQRFNQAMLLRGSLERLTPVLMTALVAALALAPLLFEAERPGTEILHPVAVVIFGGLISSTLLDSFLTPVLVGLFGRKAIERLVADKGESAEAF